ncbi:Kinase family protein [Quillaja saponaria]|uniref:non-specific serine/threonine protein kinase n=1 Tax=Quillaja saponaria TaxID=32244 RepID=A0AAD7L395_QUISA|nr:Kinase family protein [Quillaja saponaria]
MKDDDEGHHRHQQQPIIPALDFKNLRVISAVGRGAKGVVFLTRNETSNEYLALKVISKDLIEQKTKADNNDGSEYKRVSFEQQVLRRFDHPLLPRLLGVLDTEKIVGYGIEYCPGGNLYSLRKKQTEKMFSDDIIRFYAAEIVLALEYLHSLGIVYRDLKPENIMIQENGHIMLVDFDLSTKLPPRTPRSSPSFNSTPSFDSVKTKKKKKKKLSRIIPLHRYFNSGISPDVSAPILVNSRRTESDSVEKSNSFVGTEEYVAPEVVSGNGHDFGVDWWSLGVVLYEMLYGTTPFRGSNRKETFYRILTKAPELTGETTPLRDLIAKLLEKDPMQRIELEGIKGHDFFRGIEWDSVLWISRPPYIPENEIEGMKGINKIEVESFVQGIFCEKNDGGEESKNNEENVSDKGVLVEELNQNPTQSSNFFVF